MKTLLLISFSALALHAQNAEGSGGNVPLAAKPLATETRTPITDHQERYELFEFKGKVEAELNALNVKQNEVQNRINELPLTKQKIDLQQRIAKIQAQIDESADGKALKEIVAQRETIGKKVSEMVEKTAAKHNAVGCDLDADLAFVGCPKLLEAIKNAPR